MKRGLLLMNVGTPDSPSVPDVRRYLREFLSDPLVIDISPIGRWVLVNLIIAPFRSPKSAEAYSKIWTDRGSPLLFHLLDLAKDVQRRLGPAWVVRPAMRYGSPGVREALLEMRDACVDEVVLFPLYPQYSLAATKTSVDHVRAQAAEIWEEPKVRWVPPFYDSPAFLRAFEAVAKPALLAARPDHVVFSFHGLPERHMRKIDETGQHCLVREGCCDAIVEANRNCYRAQCFATARSLARDLRLVDGAWEVAFQSRLGRDPWIRPYTDERINELARAGIKRVAVLCPAFVADCLETLEEIEIRAAEEFEANGGEELTLVPSLNASPQWARAVVELVRR